MTRSILLVLTIAVAAAGCKSVECGDGTIERDGKCQPADETVGNAVCGPFTQLEGDKCVPMFPPTICDPGTTMSDPDPTTVQMRRCRPGYARRGRWSSSGCRSR